MGARQGAQALMLAHQGLHQLSNLPIPVCFESHYGVHTSLGLICSLFQAP